MTPDRFCDWLQGFVELTETDSISDKQWLVIKDHLKLVFDKKTPDRTIEVKPTITPTDWTKLSDLIGKDSKWNLNDYTWPTSPVQITC